MKPWWDSYSHRLFKALWYPFASRRLRHVLRSLVGNSASFLDASAGDDHFILTLSAALRIANDASDGEIRSLRRSGAQTSRASVTALPFPNYSFDVVLCKNTFHHLTPQERAAALQELRRVARRVIIVDIEDPRLHWWSRAFNLYYQARCGDDDGTNHFLTRTEFETLLPSTRFQYVPTVKGTYMIGVLDA